MDYADTRILVEVLNRVIDVIGRSNTIRERQLDLDQRIYVEGERRRKIAEDLILAGPPEK